MKKKRWKLAGIFLMAALTVPSLGGCKVGNTQIRLSSGQLRNHNAIVRINDHKYDIRYAKLYLCNYRNLYGKAYGTDLWESYDADLEQYVKDVTIQELTHIACMDILAENQDMHLSEQEKKQAARAAKEYYQSLTEEEKTFIGLYEREIRTAYEEYALAEKLYHALTQGTDEEVSDDEARVVRVQQIYVKEKEALRAVQENLAAGDDFASVASAYNQSREFERTIARGTYPDAMEEIVFNLDDGACSDVIAADDGYYIIRCLNKFEKDLTEENKEKIRVKKKKERFENEYQTFVKNSTFRLNDSLWDNVTLKDVSGIETDSFFSMYEKYFTTEESKSDDAKEEEKEPERSTIYYVTDKAQQGQYIKMFKEQGMNAVILDHNIDTSFITQLEQRNEHYQFKRIDADVTDALKSDDAADLTEETNTLSDLFKKTLNNDKLTVKVESLKDADVASILTLSEQGRRMQDMMKMYAAGGMGGMDPNMFAADQTLTLNANNALVKYLFEHKDSEHSGMFAEQLYDLAMLSNQPLSAEAMTKFVKRSNDIMLLLTK